MYRGFNVFLNTTDKESHELGKKIFNKTSLEIGTTLNEYLSANGSIDATLMQKQWFPKINAEVFISHSHKDFDKAISLSGYLQYTFGLTSFVDSCLWEHANKLLRMIDDKYCLNYSNSYSYQKRNLSTTHVHLLLSTAIMMMIDQCECLFFLNTPKSISSNEVISRSKSAWIYSELAISQLVRKKSIQTHRKLFEKGFSKQASLHENYLFPDFEYEVETMHLANLETKDFDNWCKNWDGDEHALDTLYSLKPLHIVSE